MIWPIARSLLFHFDPENAHLFATRALHAASKMPGFQALLQGNFRAPRVQNPTRAFGLEFEHPIGLAAGFDKHAEWLPILPSLGFSFAEIGTVTPRPQPGNPRPRLFRDRSDESLFNRMGFNSIGAELVALRVENARKSLPRPFRVGINVGINKGTSPEDAPAEYAKVFERFRTLGDLFILNVSSPNTPGLRDLQSADTLLRILEATRRALGPSSRPILVKLAPELPESELDSIIPALEQAGVGGFVVSNTVAGQFAEGSGGWSGGRIREASRSALHRVRVRTRLDLVASGGVMDPSEAQMRIESGASLVELYTGWIYRGPSLPGNCVRALSKTTSKKT